MTLRTAGHVAPPQWAIPYGNLPGKLSMQLIITCGRCEGLFTLSTAWLGEGLKEARAKGWVIRKGRWACGECHGKVGRPRKIKALPRTVIVPDLEAAKRSLEAWRLGRERLEAAEL